MKVHAVIDIQTGQTMIRGRSGRMYGSDEYERARRGKDPESLAMRADMDRSDMTDVDLRQAMLDELHDCPECRAAMAAGVQPHFGTAADLAAMQPRRKPKRSKLRWRQQRRAR